MAYSEELADRVRDLIFDRGGVTEKKMFGGLAWMINGNMAVATLEADLLVRLPPEDVEAALGEPNVGPMDRTGKQLGGFVIVAEEALIEDEDLEEWVDAGADTAAYMPPKD